MRCSAVRTRNITTAATTTNKIEISFKWIAITFVKRFDFVIHEAINTARNTKFMITNWTVISHNAQYKLCLDFDSNEIVGCLWIMNGVVDYIRSISVSALISIFKTMKVFIPKLVSLFRPVNDSKSIFCDNIISQRPNEFPTFF